MDSPRELSHRSLIAVGSHAAIYTMGGRQVKHSIEVDSLIWCMSFSPDRTCSACDDIRVYDVEWHAHPRGRLRLVPTASPARDLLLELRYRRTSRTSLDGFICSFSLSPVDRGHRDRLPPLSGELPSSRRGWKEARTMRDDD